MSGLSMLKIMKNRFFEITNDLILEVYIEGVEYDIWNNGNTHSDFLTTTIRLNLTFRFLHTCEEQEIGVFRSNWGVVRFYKDHIYQNL